MFFTLLSPESIDVQIGLQGGVLSYASCLQWDLGQSEPTLLNLIFFIYKMETIK